MPNPIKAFFEKKKTEARFKMAGPGNKLGDAAAAEQSAAMKRDAAMAAVNMRQQPSTSRGEVSMAQRQAAEAAMARVHVSQGTAEDFEKKRSQAVIRAQAQKELEMQKKQENEAQKLKDTYGEKKVINLEVSPICPGVFFHCSLVGNEVLPKDEMKAKIKAFLYDQLEHEKGLTACLMIHTFAKDAEKAKLCINTLCKYLDNILENPKDEKFRKIRKSNKAFQERVASFEGYHPFLEAVGFETQTIDDQEFFILPGEILPEQLEVIQLLKEGLLNSEPIRAELDRGMKVLLPQQASKHFDLPPEFFSLSAEEIRKEQQAKTELLEREGMLRTKAMREKEEQREKRKYKYTLVRIRFPDGLVLQGTFSIYEKYRAVHEFVTECLANPLPFVLYQTSHRLETTDYDTFLVDLKLVPSALLTFSWHPEIAEEINKGLGKNQEYLKEEVKTLLSPQ